MSDPTRPQSAVPPAEPAPDWVALARLAAREPATTDDDRARDAAARSWLAAHPAESARLRALETALGDVTRATADVPRVDVEGALAKVRAAARADRSAGASAAGAPAASTGPQLTVVRGGAPRPVGGRAGAPQATVRFQQSRATGWRRATGLLAASALLAAGLAWWRTGGLAGRSLTGPGIAAAGTATPQRHTTGVGERQVLHLADGTQVVLGPASTLDVPAGYGGNDRRVRLTGEAYFRAVHDAGRPFEVAAGDAVVRDIGTAFVVRAPAPTSAAHAAGATGQTAVDVAVTDGAVRLRAAPAGAGGTPGAPATGASGDGVLLQAGDRGRVLAAAGDAAPTVAVVARGTDVAADTAWTTGRLVFRDTPLGDVAGALRRWYGLDVRFADPALAERHLTATFGGESTDVVLRAVGLATGARLDRHGDTVVVQRAAPSP